MKNNIIIFVAILMLSLISIAQDINPYLVDSQILPKPLMPAEFNGTGVVSFIVGNSGSDDMNLVANQEMKLTITLSYGVPNAANPVDAIGGTWSGYFDWSYNSGDNTFHAVQNQDIPSQVGGVSGTVTILYKVTENSKISNMNNGFAINIVPPAYAIYNNVLDDSASDFTNVEAYDYGDAPSSYGSAVHLIDLYKSGGSYENYVYLGSSVDPEPANQASADATGDDTNDSDNDATGGEDDEDGVVLPAVFIPGEWALIQVNVTVEDGASAYLNGWIDWNGDGTFTDESEEEVVYTSVYVDPPGPPPPYWLTSWYMDVSWSGVYDVWVEVPANANIGNTFARFRIGSYDAGHSGSDSYGEVEDYQISVYVPANLDGYLFVDENSTLVCDAGDSPVTNAAVNLFVNGAFVETVTTDIDGYYLFEEIQVGSVSVSVSRANATLVDVPVSGSAATDEMRNRALPGDGGDAYVLYSIVSGYGVLETVPGEPLNFGFSQHPLSTQISLEVYAASDGRVMMEISTVNENGTNEIEIFAKINGEWFEVGSVPSEQIVGFGSNTYTIEIEGLTPGESYIFKVVDESGHIFESDPIAVAYSALKVQKVTLTPEMVEVTFNTEYGSFYQVMVCEALGASWVIEFVQYPTARGWSDLSSEPFMGGPGESTTVRIPRNRAKAFFKIIKTE